MKYVYLFVALTLTFFAFFMSAQSGEVSSDISGSISLAIYQLIIEPSQLFSLSYDSFHLIIRKLAHVSEYFLLGLIWTLVIHKFRIKVLYIFILGLSIAFIDETIQMFAFQRGPSLFDVFIYDYLSFVIASALMIKLSYLSKQV